MKTFFRVIVLLTILLSISYLPSAFHAFNSITKDPEGWQGGVNENSTLAWFVIIVIGYGYLSIQTLLAVFGLFFGFKKRKAAFWLLMLPGIIGLVLGLTWLILLALYDLEWPSSWFVAFILLFPPFIAFISGTYVRTRLLRRTRRLHP
jgi:hypothetical protein